MLVAVNYHYVRPSFDAPHPGIHGVTPEQLERQLKILGACGSFVSADDVCAAVRRDRELPDRSIAITFDDGLREQYQHALPVLRKLGVPAIFFVNTMPIAEKRVSLVHKIHLLRSVVAPGSFVAMMERHAARLGVRGDAEVDHGDVAEQYPYDPPDIGSLKYRLNFFFSRVDRDCLVEACFQEVFTEKETQISESLYLSCQQIAALGTDRMIGSHGHEHLPLGLLAPEETQFMVRQSLELLKLWTGYRPFAMSYPYGNRTASFGAGEIASRWGVEFAFTIEKAGNGQENLKNPMYLARIDANDAPGGKSALWTAESLFSSMPVGAWYREDPEVACRLNRG